MDNKLRLFSFYIKYVICEMKRFISDIDINLNIGPKTKCGVELIITFPL